MRRLLPSPSMAVALAALVIAVGTGGAVAGTLITGKQVKNRSLSGLDLRRDSVGGAEVREAALRKVPASVRADGAARAESAGRADTAGRADSAGRADAAGRADTAATAETVGGLGPDALLRADRILSATARNEPDSAGALLWRDPGTGLEVRVGPAGTYRPELRNTGPSVLSVSGLGFFSTGLPVRHIDFEVDPGASGAVTFDATGMRYAQFIVSRKNAVGPDGATIAVTCQNVVGSPGAPSGLSCVGVR